MSEVLIQIEAIAKQVKATRQKVALRHSKQTGKAIDGCRKILAKQIRNESILVDELQGALDAIHNLDNSIGNATLCALESLERELNPQLDSLAHDINTNILGNRR